MSDSQSFDSLCVTMLLASTVLFVAVSVWAFLESESCSDRSQQLQSESRSLKESAAKLSSLVEAAQNEVISAHEYVTSIIPMTRATTDDGTRQVVIDDSAGVTGMTVAFQEGRMVELEDATDLVRLHTTVSPAIIVRAAASITPVSFELFGYTYDQHGELRAGLRFLAKRFSELAAFDVGIDTANAHSGAKSTYWGLPLSDDGAPLTPFIPEGFSEERMQVYKR
jgi:hypothetical protein